MNFIHTVVVVAGLVNRLVLATAQVVLQEMEAKAAAEAVHRIGGPTQAVLEEKTERTTVQTELQPPTHKQLLEAQTEAQVDSSQAAVVEQVQVAEDKAEMAVLEL
jgi:Na+-transporting NADH:ubiquinone oxidoreductase subunit NqrC